MPDNRECYLRGTMRGVGGVETFPVSFPLHRPYAHPWLPPRLVQENFVQVGFYIIGLQVGFGALDSSKVLNFMFGLTHALV